MKRAYSNRDAVLLISLIIIIICGLCISGISAFFLAADRADNVSSAGNNGISVEEIFENPDIEPDEVTEITKQVTVKNTGINYAGIRIRAEFSSSEIERTETGDTSKWAVVDYNTSDWTKSGDYWYYNVPVGPGMKTEPLFSRIICDHPTAEQVEDFEVYIYAESRGCDGNSDLSDIKDSFS